MTSNHDEVVATRPRRKMKPRSKWKKYRRPGKGELKDRGRACSRTRRGGAHDIELAIQGTHPLHPARSSKHSIQTRRSVGRVGEKDRQETLLL